MLNIRINPPFRLLFDLRWMELGQAGGIEQATYELIAAIGQLDRKNSYRILAPRSAAWEWDFPPQFKVTRHYSQAGEPRGKRFHEFVARFDALNAQPEFADVAFDLVHSTCSYIHPELLRFPGVLTLHDLQHLHHPEFFSPAEWQDRERLYRDSAARAAHIICVSEFTRRDAHERFGIPLEKMTTIWNIPSRAVWREIAAPRRRALLESMGLSGPFLFYPAHCWPHKNHAAAVQAFERAIASLPAEVKLVFTGREFPVEHPAAALMRHSAVAGRVLHLGYRSPLEVRALFQECTALFFPSLFEGFGMPVAEAIIAGKPIACSNTTALPEVAGDAAVTFNPRDVDEMAWCIVEIATEPALREGLAAAARRRRNLFSMRLSAIKTLAVYERAFAEMAVATA